MARRKSRTFNEPFKVDAVRVVMAGGKAIAVVTARWRSAPRAARSRRERLPPG